VTGKSSGHPASSLGEILPHEKVVPDWKRCARCQTIKPASEFRPNQKLQTGLHSWCRSCAAARTREWRAAHPDYMEAEKAKRRDAYRKSNQLPELVCSECGSTFRARPNKLTCSDACRRRRKARLDTR
jgi:hypothetical protein